MIFHVHNAFMKTMYHCLPHGIIRLLLLQVTVLSCLCQHLHLPLQLLNLILLIHNNRVQEVSLSLLCSFWLGIYLSGCARCQRKISVTASDNAPLSWG